MDGSYEGDRRLEASGLFARFAAVLAALAAIALVLAWGCRSEAGEIFPGAAGDSAAASEPPAELPAPVTLPSVEADPARARPPFAFSVEDERLLDEAQRGAFNYLWNAVHPETGMVRDRSSTPLVSIAGVGFQLSGICVGVERGWITRAQGEERVLRILRALEDHPDNRKAGLFYHFLLGNTGGPDLNTFEHVVSTIDSAIFFAGALTASSYFGGEAGAIADRLWGGADWAFFRLGEKANPWERGFISLGWKPAKVGEPRGAGELLRYGWIDAGCEHRLVTFLAVCAAEGKSLDPAMYYRLRRGLGEYKDTGPFVFFPWSGALFTHIFSHCWIDYAGMGMDNPMSLGVQRRPRVDWWENSRRAVMMHRAKAIENPLRLPTFGENAWGLTASDAEGRYAVPGLFPKGLPLNGLAPELDVPMHVSKDDWGDGTVAPYAAAGAVMFEPAWGVAALRHYREAAARLDDGRAARKNAEALWRDPARGGYGFADAYNEGTGWVAPDCVAIDQGPLLLSLENARSGLVWKLFHRHPAVRAGMERLKLELSGR